MAKAITLYLMKNIFSIMRERPRQSIFLSWGLFFVSHGFCILIPGLLSRFHLRFPFQKHVFIGIEFIAMFGTVILMTISTWHFAARIPSRGGSITVFVLATLVQLGVGVFLWVGMVFCLGILVSGSTI